MPSKRWKCRFSVPKFKKISGSIPPDLPNLESVPLTFWDGLTPLTARKPILVNTNITQATLHGQERFPGYVPSFIVPTKFVAMMIDELLNLELNNIVSFVSWNGFPRKLSRKLLTLFKPSSPNPNNSNNVVIDPTTTKIWINLPFLGKYGTKLTNNFIREISPLLKSPCKFIVNWKTTDTNCFISLKDPTPKTYQSSVVYEFKCPGCNANYVGKTDRCLYTRIKEHSSLDSSEIYNHITSCNEFNYVINLLELTPTDEVNNIKCSVSNRFNIY